MTLNNYVCYLIGQGYRNIIKRTNDLPVGSSFWIILDTLVQLDNTRSHTIPALVEQSLKFLSGVKEK